MNFAGIHTFRGVIFSNNFNVTPSDYEDYHLNEASDGIESPGTMPEIAPGACQQYFALGSVIPEGTITFMSKLVFKTSSFNSLFNMPTMQRLCAIDSILDREMDLNGLNGSKLKRLPFSFNLPYYTMCLNMQQPSNSCYSLNIDDIEMFKSLILTCQSEDPPIQCQLPIAQQLSSMIFQRRDGPVDLEKPIYIAVVLPVTLSLDGRTNLHFYSNLLQRLKEDYDGNGLQLVGAQFGVKDGLFEEKIRGDARLGALAILLVVVIVLIYTNSFFFTFCIAAGLILSIGVAFFIYTIVFGVKFFPFLNLLAMILVVAVGADDAFLFMYQYRKHKKDASEKWSPLSSNDICKTLDKNSDKEELLEYHRRRVVSALSDALSHAAVAMFVTSATTAVAFFANVVSKIMVLRYSVLISSHRSGSFI
ncbi:unnamed protein product [Gongylonema pulchrum]|uniref:SSD domain-containing protein n=1 Tax=Gongylonema pulchrum TaxID=637853 RepID=A0A183CUZ2_9BILA|nr:unnamed protein product [Gongylonema pulchrum]